MKILAVNKYFFYKGGAEEVFFHTAELLRTHGHRVVPFSMDHPRNVASPYSKYFVSRVDFNEPGTVIQKLRSAARILYSMEAKRKIEALIKTDRPDLAHLHNIHHQISPSILHVLKKFRIPTVMTLHDYKMVCPVYTLWDRERGVCEKCKNRKYYWCLLKRCNRGSFLRSWLNTVEMVLHHKILDLSRLVDVFITPSVFLQDKLKEMGFNGRMVHLANFLPFNDFDPSFTSDEKSLVYFGRLSEEKGLPTLLAAIKGLTVKCRIIGEGPLKTALKGKIEREGFDHVVLMGYRRGKELKEEIRRSSIVVLPSEWYENHPLSVLEAFALGKPVIASRIGGIPELVIDNRTGFTFESKNVRSLRERILFMLGHPEKVNEMGRNARKFVEERCDSQKYYEALIKIYEFASAKGKDGSLHHRDL